MTTNLFRSLAALALGAMLAGCEIIECRICGAGERVVYTEVEPVTITVTGYGALDPALAANLAQQKLMALRASEVEAYRSLAERVKGVEISANSQVSDFLTDADRMSALVDAYVLRRSRISSQGYNAEGYYETILSLTLNEHFLREPVQTMEAYVYKPARDKYHTDHREVVRTHSTTEVHYDTGVHTH